MQVLFSVGYWILAFAGIMRNISSRLHADAGIMRSITSLLHANAAIVKTLPAIFLAIWAWTYSRPRFGPWVAIGALLGAVGDYSLANADRAWFMAGLCAFLVGHIAYSIAFAKDLRWTTARGVVIGITGVGMLALVAAVGIHMAHKGELGLIAPVAIYVAVMGVMMALSVLHDSPTPLIAIGGVMFVISDAHIAINHMLLAKTWLPFTLSGYTTYYLAQYLIVAGAVFETRRRTA